MASIRVLGWNVENYGDSKWDKGGDDLVQFIAQLIIHQKIDIAAFSELRSGRAEDVGNALVKVLNKSGGSWASIPSNARGTNRWEQYLFVWNKSRLTNNPIQSKPNPNKAALAPFLDMFFAADGKQIGFRRVLADRPPCLAEFDLASGGAGKLRVAVMHSPNPGYWKDPQDAAVALAGVGDLRPANVPAVLLGDFNVRANSNASNGNFGQGAFGALVASKFEQQLPNDSPSSLKPRKMKPQSPGECTSEPYDQIFAWDPPKNPPTKSFSKPRVVDVIGESLKDADLEKKLLVLLNKKRSAVAPLTLVDAFEAYRCMVSDHFPVAVEVAL